MLTLEDFRAPVLMLGFAPNGKALATLSGGGPGSPGELKLWRAAEDRRAAEYERAGAAARGHDVAAHQTRESGTH